MIQVSIDASEMAVAARSARALGDEIVRDMQAAVASTALGTQERARARAPVFTGVLANSIQIAGPQVRSRGDDIVVAAEIQSAQPYTSVQEDGRRPGAKWPPLQPILRWVQLKLRRGDLQIDASENEEQAIRRITFLVRRKIGTKGIVGKKFFEAARGWAEEDLVRRMRELAAKWRLT